ncbi:MAG: tellurite resistance TerB family protein [Halieaceae bacterium]|jgi:uncharacterized membrane protein YebE (DUF533 family)|nr:tellurite resistance TerB family protein [Halieaceae bacterium]
MVDFNKLVASITGSGMGAGLAGGVAGGALVSALTTKSGRKAAKSVAKVGGLAAVGALAWTAYKRYQGDSAGGTSAQAVEANPVSPPAAVRREWQQLPQQQFETLSADGSGSQGMLVLRAMISAAMADGHLSPLEQARIFDRLDRLGLTPEERDTLFDELRNPLSCKVLAAQVSDPVLAIEVYTAAALMVDTTCAAAGLYLAELAHRLELPEPLVASIHKNTAVTQLAHAS